MASTDTGIDNQRTYSRFFATEVNEPSKIRALTLQYPSRQRYDDNWSFELTKDKPRKKFPKLSI